jgi:hypothetical protein
MNYEINNLITTSNQSSRKCWCIIWDPTNKIEYLADCPFKRKKEREKSRAMGSFKISIYYCIRGSVIFCKLFSNTDIIRVAGPAGIMLGWRKLILTGLYLQIWRHKYTLQNILMGSEGNLSHFCFKTTYCRDANTSQYVGKNRWVQLTS